MHIKTLAKIIFTGLLFIVATVTTQAATTRSQLNFKLGYATLLPQEMTALAVAIPRGVRLQYWSRGEWKPLSPDNDTTDEQHKTSTALLPWAGEQSLALRASGSFSGRLPIEIINEDATPVVQMMAARTNPSDLKIVSRREWGADESLRYAGASSVETLTVERESESVTRNRATCAKVQKSYPDEFEVTRRTTVQNGHRLLWPLEYSKRVRKVVIHHTAGTGTAPGLPAAAIVRSIYRYHAVTRGWGDIGYNYLLAPDGTIFEGRAGGDAVVGGHAYCNNVGTIGISLLGNYEHDEVTVAQRNALGKLLPMLAQKYQLDLTAAEDFHGAMRPNLLGHRDLGQTTCPGRNIYNLLPSLRKFIYNAPELRDARSFKTDGQPVGALPILHLQAGAKHRLTLSFKNSGNTTWGGDTWLFGSAGDGLRLKSLSPTRSYLAAKMQQRQVAPGETATFKVEFSAGSGSGLRTMQFVPVVRDKRVTAAETLQLV